MRFIQADIVYPISSKPIKNGIIVLNDDGKVEDVLDEKDEIDPSKIEKHTGSISPGFVNAHCHLELSHLKGVISQKKGLIEFAKGVISNRNTKLMEFVGETMLKADEEMKEAGIVAVGDISNGSHSFAVKQKSKIYYHTFIELIGLNPANADKIMEVGVELMKEAEHRSLKASFVPHAPYSTSYEMMKCISEIASKNNSPVCIHNQESKEENKFFENKTGNFTELYKSLNLPTDYFKATSKTSLQSYLEYLQTTGALMLVHNTFSSVEDIEFANKLHSNLFWCLCPNANLYIENALPDVKMLTENNCKITIGTDSLASNHQLDVMNELSVLKKNFPSLTMWQLFQWATLNGARFLGIDKKFGSIEKGKSPGLVLVDEESMEVKRVL
ncbi:MAG: amidohydrolase family protein [Bacteroidota bacterium]|nr:amidohydrolase family protein [Bacteroidota bacterium]